MMPIIRKTSKWCSFCLLVTLVLMTTGTAVLAYEVKIGDGIGAPGSSGSPISITAASLPADLAGFQVYIKYDTNVLTPDTSSLTLHPDFIALTNASWSQSANIQVIDATYNSLTILLYDGNVAGSLASATPVTICTVTFSVASGAKMPNNPLEVQAGSPGLADANGNPVATEWVNGNFRIK